MLRSLLDRKISNLISEAAALSPSIVVGLQIIFVADVVLLRSLRFGHSPLSWSLGDPPSPNSGRR